MELRIIIDKSTEKLTGIGRDQLCYFQYDIQYKFPYLVRNGQLERCIGNLCKERTNSFVRFKSLYGTEYVVLHQRE